MLILWKATDQMDQFKNEADVLNMVLFSKTAKHWRNEKPDLKGNIREYATIE